MNPRDRLEGEGSLGSGLRRPGPIEFTLEQREEPGRTILSIAGELDLLTIPRLAARLDEIVRRGSGHLVVDVRALDFIDSSGLQILMGARRRLQRDSRTLSVVCVRGPVRQAIERARLSDTLGLAADELA